MAATSSTSSGPSASASASSSAAAAAASSTLWSQPKTTSTSTPPPPQLQPGKDTQHMDVDDKVNVAVNVAASNSSNPPSTPRRFLPQPIEESVRSSRRRAGKADDVDEAGSQPAAEVESTSFSTGTSISTVKPRRRFAPEPVETTIRSNRGSKKDQTKDSAATVTASTASSTASSTATAKPRRFAPVPIESSASSSKDRQQRKRRKDESAPSPSSSSPSSSSPRGSRRFSPELLETARGSYRHSTIHLSPELTIPESPTQPDSPFTIPRPSPPTSSESRFSAAALAKRHHELHRRHSFQVPDLPCIESDSGDDSEAPSVTNSRSSADSEYKSSNKPSTISSTANTKSPAPLVTASTTGPGKEEEEPDYVIKLAKTATERQLQEQAMAAYINERPHEQIAHYGFDEDDNAATVVASAAAAAADIPRSPIRVGRLSGEKGVDVRTFRRSSQDEHDWEMQNMRNHHKKLEQMKRDFKQDVAGASRFSAAALATRHHLQEKEREKKKKKVKAAAAAAAAGATVGGGGGGDDDEEDSFNKMKKAASPPMLGGDLVFPYTISPKMTRCDTDQVPRPRIYESDDEDDEGGNGSRNRNADTGVWTSSKGAGAGQPMWNAKVTVQAPQGDGLWMGLCQVSSNDPARPVTPTRSGIQTPAACETSNPFDSIMMLGSVDTPGNTGSPSSRRPGNLSPGCRVGHKLWDAVIYSKPQPQLQPESDKIIDDHFTSSIDSKLLLEAQIDQEFPDSFITQIYNYLSLGYPCLAWAFDEELSKISRISVEDLRKDDGLVDARGYVGVPEGEHSGSAAAGHEGKTCRRWEALRLYVREWARQSPGFRDSADARGSGKGTATGWGGNVAVRKGSWGH